MLRHRNTIGVQLLQKCMRPQSGASICRLTRFGPDGVMTTMLYCNVFLSQPRPAVLRVDAMVDSLVQVARGYISETVYRGYRREQTHAALVYAVTRLPSGVHGGRLACAASATSPGHE